MVSPKSPHRIKAVANAVGRSLRFRSIQQKLGVYAFILSLLAVSGVSYFSYKVARNQIQDDRLVIATSIIEREPVHKKLP